MNQNTNHKPEVMNLPDAIAAKLAAEELRKRSDLMLKAQIEQLLCPKHQKNKRRSDGR